jgi:hypothetical protein
MTALSNAELSAINCTLFALASVRGSATSELETGIRLHEENDARNYSMAHVRACGGDHKSALVLAQLEYWTPRAKVKRDGYVWIKKSVTDWEIEMMLGRKEIDRINRALVQKGLVVINQYPWGHFKSPSAHYRLTEKALALMGAPAPKGQVVSKAPAPKGQVTENTKTTENTNQTLTSASNKTLATGSTPECTKEEGENPKPTPATLPEKYLKDEKKLSWITQWETPVGSLTLTPLNPKQCGAMKAVGNSLWKHHIDPKELIQYTKENWNKFTLRTMKADGLTVSPEITDKWASNFFVKHVDIAAHLLGKHHADNAAWANQAAKYAEWAAEYDAKKTAEAAAPKDTPASVDEVLAGMAALNAISKPAKPLETVDVSDVPERTTEGPLPLTEAQKEAALKNYLATALANKGTPANYLFGN